MGTSLQPPFVRTTVTVEASGRGASGLRWPPVAMYVMFGIVFVGFGASAIAESSQGSNMHVRASAWGQLALGVAYFVQAFVLSRKGKRENA